MKLLVEPLGIRHRLALIVGGVTIALLAVLIIAARARATETVYWDNYEDNPTTVGFSGVDGSGGGLINLGSAAFKQPEGMTYDPVTNRLYIAAETLAGKGAIVYVNLDGSGGGFFSAPNAPEEEPEGITLDPVTRTLYWINTESSTISWARLDGSAGGQINTSGAPIEGSYRLTIDPAAGRLYWGAESGSERVISFANLNQAGGGVLPATLSFSSVHGIATDPANGRIYIVGPAGEGFLGSVPLGGGPVQMVPLGSAYKEGYGLAVDPLLQRAYWGNYGQKNTEVEALGFSGLEGSAGTISPAAAHANGPQDPLILKSPTGTGAPQVTQQVTALSCSQGSWSQDYPGANVFTAPTSYGYQWSLNGQAIPGATASTLTATTAGAYSCSVTGKNATGSATQTGVSTATVTPTSLSAALLTKKAHAKAGKAAVVKVRLSNGGDLSSTPVSVCAKFNKKAKKGLIAPKCASVGALGFDASATATLRVKTKKSARGVYKFTTQVKGTTVEPVTVSVKVNAAKKHKKHHKTM